MSTDDRIQSADQRGADLDFYFDPVCPFAWMTSKWVRMVAEQRGYKVDWRFISLRMINADIDYESHVPPGYEDGHTRGSSCCGWPHAPGRNTGRKRSGRCIRPWDGGYSTAHPKADRTRELTRAREPFWNRFWRRPTCRPSS